MSKVNFKPHTTYMAFVRISKSMRKIKQTMKIVKFKKSTSCTTYGIDMVDLKKSDSNCSNEKPL